MSTVKVTIALPFLLRLKNSITVRYDDICKESPLKELGGHSVQIIFRQTNANTIDKSGWSKVRSTVTIKVKTPTQLPDSSIGTFAIHNCLEILNRVITSYQATTGEVSNAGSILPLGISDMQLFAEILVNGKDFRDRWPSHSINSFPLPQSKIKEYKRYLSGKEDLPLARLFLVNATLSLERGQYPSAVLQAATAVELIITQVISKKLVAGGWSEEAIKPYRKMTLGQKLNIPRTDPRSLETYFYGVADFDNLYKKIKAQDKLTNLRNDVAHRGYLVSYKEAKWAVKMTHGFLKIVK